MRPRERRETGRQDLFRSRLDQIIDLNHPLVKLAKTIDWSFLERHFGEVYKDGPGQPPLPTRLMAGLAILKHSYDLSDEVLCERWVENPYYQYFCGEEFFQHRLVFDRSSMTHWRSRMGEERLKALLQESLSVAAKTGAIKPSELSRVIVDTTVQPKNVTFPTDAKLLNRAREKLVRLARQHGLGLRQSYARLGKIALIQHQRYAHAKQFKRARRALKKLRTYLGRVMRDIGRKINGNDVLRPKFARLLSLASRVHGQQQHQRGPKVYSLHAPEVECIGKGKPHRPYEFGVKVSVVTTLAHAKQFKRARRMYRKLRTYLGRVMRDIGRRIDGNDALRTKCARLLSLARRVHEQQQYQRGPKVYSLHAPEVECIGKGKPHRPYEFGVKVSVATTLAHAKGGQFVAHVKTLPGNPYDGHTLATVIPDMQAMLGNTLERIYADKGYRGHNAPPEHRFRVFIAGQKRRMTPAIKRQLRRRSAIEPVIGHLKAEHRMGRNYLWHRHGDVANAILAAAGYNFRRLIRWLSLLWCLILAALTIQLRLAPV